MSFAPTPGPGRPARYCRRSHRQRAYEARRLAEARELADNEVLVLRSDLLAMRDAIFRLEAALEDADIDLADGSSPEEVLIMVAKAARGVTRFEIEPIAARS